MGKINITRNLKQSKPQLLLKDLDVGSFFTTSVDYITNFDGYQVYIKLENIPEKGKTKVIDVFAGVTLNLDWFAGVVELKANIAVEEL